MTQKIALTLFAVVLALSCVVAYRLIKADVTADAYLERLEALTDDYEDLRQDYNTAVSKTAVTELLVEDGVVCVLVRTADGKERRIATPYAAGAQVYVEYMVIDGRLWIRRVFDDRTAPEKGVVIDPDLASVDWDSPKVAVSKAISRRLTEGRWVITVTGDGSLGLAESARPKTLEPNPPIGSFEPKDEAATNDVESIGPVEVLRHAVSGE